MTTWFEACELTDGSGWVVIRADSASLPHAVVVSVGHKTHDAAKDAADQMRRQWDGVDPESAKNSFALNRLIDEVRVDREPVFPGGYNRTHNRHNR